MNRKSFIIPMQIGIVFFLFVSIASSCKKKEESVKEEVTFKTPSGFPAPVYDFTLNPVTKAGFELGRKLFYEAKLSRDNTVSCGSCHQQFNAFVHGDHVVSHGIDGLLGKRNTPSIVNMAWSNDFFWDGGVHQLDLVSPNPIKNPVEMDEQLSNVLEKLRNDPKYPPLFKSAFGTEEISTTKFLQAMSQFMNMLVSANSRYDKFVKGEGGVFTSDELEGKSLFEQNCASCHASVLFTDRGFHNNGIQPSITDSGRFAITMDPADIGKFKTPSLRNIARTAPYMHNGKFSTLEQVLDHYANGVNNSSSLDSLLKQGGTLGIALTSEEKRKLIAFLQTLTDADFLSDPKFSEQ